MNNKKPQSLSFNTKPDPDFEITLVIRDNQGKPTGQTKTFSSDNSSKVNGFWQHNTKRKKKKKNKSLNNLNKLITEEEIEDLTIKKQMEELEDSIVDKETKKIDKQTLRVNMTKGDMAE